MNVQQFLNLEINKENQSARFNASEGNCNALAFLYGGASAAAAIETLELITERPLVSLSCQFNNFAKLGSEIQIKAEESVRGGNISHASLRAMADDALIFSALATLGQRTHPLDTQFITMPVLDSPENCPQFGGGKREGKYSIDSRIDYRVARGSLRKDKPVHGQMALWARVPELKETSASSIAFMADYLPVSVGSMLEKAAGGNSLDNQLRILSVEQSEWILLDCEAKGVSKGFAHATMNIWSERGRLLALASQSIIFREFDLKKVVSG